MAASSEESQVKSTQITLKIPTAFLKEFDEISSQLGYPRNEAVREAMRRFMDWGFQKVNERHPERNIGAIQGIMSALFGGIAQIQEGKTQELPKSGSAEPPSLPDAGSQKKTKKP